MNELVQTISGFEKRALTSEEVLALAKKGNRQAIGEVVASKSGWEALTAAQKEEVFKALLMLSANL